MLLEKSGRIFLLVLIFLVISYIFNQINDYIERENLNRLRYTNNTIENFIYISKSDKEYKLTGQKIIKVKEDVYIEKPYLIYKSNDKSFDLTGDLATYYGQQKIIGIYNNVKVLSENFQLITDKLFIDTERKIAYNYSQNYINSEKMQTIGRNLFFNFEEENIRLQNVKTTVRGKDA
jgi:LPS export ABC transporter protein LptC